MVAVGTAASDAVGPGMYYSALPARQLVPRAQFEARCRSSARLRVGVGFTGGRVVRPHRRQLFGGPVCALATGASAMAPVIAMIGHMPNLPRVQIHSAEGSAETVPAASFYFSGEKAAGTTSMFSCFKSAPGGDPGGQIPLLTASPRM